MPAKQQRYYTPEEYLALWESLTEVVKDSSLSHELFEMARKTEKFRPAVHSSGGDGPDGGYKFRAFRLLHPVVVQPSTRLVPQQTYYSTL